MSGTIYLIMESEKDVDVVRAILKARNITVRVEPLYPTGRKEIGVSRLAKELERLIAEAIAERQPGNCIAVLHDADEFEQVPHRGDYQRIQSICQKHRREVVPIIADDELESWLLADEGICRWLGIKAENQDSRQKPKEYLNSLVKDKTGKRYQGANRSKVLDHIDGNTHSPSLQQALKHLDNAPCVER